MAQTGILLAHGTGPSKRPEVGRRLQTGVKELVVQTPGQPWYGTLKLKGGNRNLISTIKRT